MKNFLFSNFKVVALIMLTLATVLVTHNKTEAQSSTSTLTTGTYARDSVAASETGTLHFATGQQISTYQRAGSVSVEFLKISGAPAASAKLYGSPNNTDWYQASDSVFTVANVAGDQGMAWIFNTPKTGPVSYKYYRVQAVATGATQSFSMRGQTFFFQ